MLNPRNSGWRSLAPSRSLVRDVVHFGKGTPSFRHARVFQLDEVVRLRGRCRRRIAWPMLFIKAYAQMASEFPVLRRSYMPLPWPHLYEHDEHVARLSIHRRQGAEDWVLWGRFVSPENEPLEALQARLEEFQRQPIEQAFKRQFKLAHLPTPIRRLAWWSTLRLSGRKRSKRVGTYFLTTVAGAGAEITEMPCLQTSGFTYGPIDETGACRVGIVYDHRLMDGHLVADMLRVFEEKLCGPIAAELLQLTSESDGQA